MNAYQAVAVRFQDIHLNESSVTCIKQCASEQSRRHGRGGFDGLSLHKQNSQLP